MKNNKITFKESLELFKSNLIINNNAPNTIEAYLTDMNIFINFISDKLNNKIYYTCDIKIIHLEEYKNYLIKHCNYKIKTCSRKYNCLRRYLRVLNTFGYINPILINYISSDKFGNTKRDKFSNNIKLLSDSTVIRILQNLNNSSKDNKLRDTCIIKLLLYLGLRRDEVLNLQWKQINFINNQITIIRNKNSSINTVTIPKSLQHNLKTYYNICYTQNKGILPTYVFYGKSINKPLSVASYNNLITIYTSNLTDIDGNLITGHTFRHTFITNCIKNNAPLADIQMYTGLDIKTLQYYTHLTANYNSKVAEILDSLYITEKTAC